VRPPDLSRAVRVLAATVAAALGVSCATSTIVKDNVTRVVKGQPMDNSGYKDALSADAKGG
jgi:hypothetical protein